MRLWAALLALIGGLARAEPQKAAPCAFYCFTYPTKDQPSAVLNRTLSVLPQLHCSHLVYGTARIDAYGEVHDPTDSDIITDAYFGNYRTLHGLRKQNPPMTVLLAVGEEEGVNFLDSVDIRDRVAKNVVQLAVRNNFDGIFLDLQQNQFSSFHFRHFVDQLRDQVRLHSDPEQAAALQLVLAIDAAAVYSQFDNIKNYEADFDVFYLKADEVIGARTDTETVLLNPLYTDKSVPMEDALSNAAEELASATIPREKIIVGLSSWARGFVLDEPKAAGPISDAIGKVQKPGTLRNDGRFAYQEICSLSSPEDYHYEMNASAVWFMGSDANWYSLSPPKHTAVERLLSWIGTREFGGLGLKQLEADDPLGQCGEGPYPLHNMVASKFKCAPREQVRGNTSPCKRVCIYRPAHEQVSVNMNGFHADWCSHYVISSQTFILTGSLVPVRGFKDVLDKFNNWSVKVKPYLLFSIGDEVDAKTWRFVMKSESLRKQLVNNINQLFKDKSPDGFVISWLNGIIGQGLSGSADIDAFHTFLEELRRILPERTMIFVTVTHGSTYAGGYKTDILNQTANYLLLESFRFHSPDLPFTGHPSPLLPHSELLTDPTMTVDSLANEWASRGIPREKLIPEFSAQVLYQGLARDERFRTDQPIGQKAISGNAGRHRANDGLMTQTELCASLNGSDARQHFISELGVPMAIKGDEFFAFDNKRSIQVKTIWTSLSRFGGMALHGLEMDNPAGECPVGEPYPLLRSIAASQACDMCLKDTDASRTVDMCVGESFRVACSYRLPDVNDLTPLKPSAIPFADCTEVVIEEAHLHPNLTLTYRDETASQNAQLLANNTRQGKRLISAIRCSMSEAQFEKVMGRLGWAKLEASGKRDKLLDRIWEHMDRYDFDGIELRFDDVLSDKVKTKFSNFLRSLLNKVRKMKSRTDAECPRTVSLRVPVWQANISAIYDMEIINHLHQVVLEPFQIESNHTQLISPIFGIESRNFTQNSIDSVLNAWIKAGLDRSRILLHIPAFGIVQTLADHTQLGHEFGASVSRGMRVISQKEVCQKLEQPGTDRHMMFDMVAAFATTTNNEFISFETQETISYKIKYAFRERLAGVGLLTINEDDHEDACHRGAFPLLKEIRNNIC